MPGRNPPDWVAGISGIRNKFPWMEKANRYGADALILDLEDSVPDNENVSSRHLVKEGVVSLKTKGQACYARVNGFAGLTSIGVGPNAVNLTDKVFKFNWLSLFSIYRSLPVFGSHAFHFFTMPLFLLDKCQYFM